MIDIPHDQLCRSKQLKDLLSKKCEKCGSKINGETMSLKALVVVVVTAIILIVTNVYSEVSSLMLEHEILSLEKELKEAKSRIQDLRDAGAVRNQRLDDLERDLNQTIIAVHANGK